MMLKSQKRIAAQILKCSPSKVIFDTTKLSDIKEAITSADIRTLISDGVINRASTNQQSHSRTRIRTYQRLRGRQRGHGSSKGRAFALVPQKKRWVARIRLQRKIIIGLRDNKEINTKVYRDLYLKAKGGFFRSKRHLELYLTEHKIRSEK